MNRKLKQITENVALPPTALPDLCSFADYLGKHARVPLRQGNYGKFSFVGREPLRFIVGIIDAILDNTLNNKTVAIGGDGGQTGTVFQPGTLKGATLTVGGGAQWGKTVLVLNFQAFATFVKFINFGYYTPDQELLAKIVDTKFRPDVIDQQPWMAGMISIGKSENASGKTVNRKNSYQAADGNRRAFGYFCGMQKPPTTISLDAAALDEVDDIPRRNIGFVDGRMTASPLHLRLEIGTQRIAGAGQNARVETGCCFVRMYECPQCKAAGKANFTWNLEENFPRIVRVAVGRAALPRSQAEQQLHPTDPTDGRAGALRRPLGARIVPIRSTSEPLGEHLANEAGPSLQNSNTPFRHPHSARAASSRHPSLVTRHPGEAPLRPADPQLTAEMGHNRDAYYYCACPECGAELDRDGGRYVARNPDQIRQAHFSIRVSQFNVSAISMQEIVGAWFAAMADPGGNAMVAFYCDRVAIPNAGAAQPITQQVLDRARGDYAMSLSTCGAMASGAATVPAGRFAGLDTGPRCWLWVDEVADPATSRLVWAELIASGNVPSTLALRMDQLGIGCVFIDAGGEPDLTKRLCLALNGLENYSPPVMPQSEMLKTYLTIGGVTWDGERGRWRGIRAAAVLFSNREAKGVEQTIGFTQDGKIYPLIKCNRAESIQTAVNDFLTPAEGVIELLPESSSSSSSLSAIGSATAEPPKLVRQSPRARLPQTFIGPGASQAVLEGHLLNLRKVRDLKTGDEDWADGLENHFGLAKAYARLAALVGQTSRRVPFEYEVVEMPGWGERLRRTKGAWV